MTELLLSVKPLLYRASIYCVCLLIAVFISAGVLCFQMTMAGISGFYRAIAQSHYSRTIQERMQNEREYMRAAQQKTYKELNLPIFGAGALLGLLSGALIDTLIAKKRKDYEEDSEESPT